MGIEGVIAGMTNVDKEAGWGVGRTGGDVGLVMAAGGIDTGIVGGCTGTGGGEGVTGAIGGVTTMGAARAAGGEAGGDEIGGAVIAAIGAIRGAAVG
jgi:hypothetical protein